MKMVFHKTVDYHSTVKPLYLSIPIVPPPNKKITIGLSVSISLEIVNWSENALGLHNYN